MTRAGSRVTALVGLIAVMIAVASCREAPPALPGALVTVETDLAVPRAASRLRVDVYAEDGTWIESRDYPRPRPEDWPASFGVLSRDETREQTVLVRIRVYPDGAVRDYLGERYEDNPPFVPARYAKTLDEVCANAEELPPLVERTMRRGPTPLLTSMCELGVEVGSVAARVTIEQPGRYRFEVVHAVPSSIVTLSLRRDCKSGTDEVCGDYAKRHDGPLMTFDTDLVPGRYVMLTGGIPWDNAADITLRWGPVAQWGPDEPPPLPPPPIRPRPSSPLPRLIRKADGRDVTPISEPHPVSTVDRLVRVRLVPGEQADVRVKLEVGCSSRMAKLVIDPQTGKLDVAASTSCPDNGSPAPTFHEEPCAESESGETTICVPGGTFAFGGVEQDLEGFIQESTTLPMRMVGVHKFVMDKNEFTVGRYREALRDGFRLDDSLGPSSEEAKSTYSATPGKKEKFPLNNVPFSLARKLCAFYGGDLPTEVQWEYAALAAGRSVKASFPWGEEAPTCENTILDREPTLEGSCKHKLSDVHAVDDPANALDVNALGIAGLGTNVAEYVRDWFTAFESPCWRAASPIDPECVDPSGPLRSVRGGSFITPLSTARGVSRNQVFALYGNIWDGFRCSYPATGPSRSWIGP